MSQNSRNEGFSYYFCLIIEGSGSGTGSVPRTNGSGSATLIRRLSDEVAASSSNSHGSLKTYRISYRLGAINTSVSIRRYGTRPGTVLGAT
jgi:hypothetical protein